MPEPKLFGMEDAEEETEPPTGMVVHEALRLGGTHCTRGRERSCREPPSPSTQTDCRIIRDGEMRSERRP
jgi:hypothetical protein